MVCDNLREAVSKACRYDPQLNPSSQQWAEHYGVVVLPARPRRPQDKAKVEESVQIIERWILARLRHCQFCSLAQVNASIKELLEELIRKPFKQILGNRLDTFKRFEQPVFDPCRCIRINSSRSSGPRSTLITTFTMSVTITRYRISMWT